MLGSEDLTEIPPAAVVVHEPHGFVHLQDCMADDLAVVNAARVSFRKQSDWEHVEWEGDPIHSEGDPIHEPEARIVRTKLSESDERVLRFLVKNRHGTPFEHTFFRFHVRAPIFVFREWHRHRIGVSINEESGRYVELRPDFYYPDAEHVRIQEGKPGRYTFRAAPEQKGDADYWMTAAYQAAWESYRGMLDAGIAKELARAVLPVGIYSQMVWTCNARSLMNFLSLRNAHVALREIRDYAEALERIFAEEMPVTHDAFVENGRAAP